MENKRLIELVKRDSTHANDNERRAIFTIFTGNNDLYSKVDDLYNFEERAINLDYFEEFYLSSGAYQLVKLAFNLYSFDNEANVAEVLRSLDDSNYELAMKAIYLRLNFLFVLPVIFSEKISLQFYSFNTLICASKSCPIVLTLA